jgi:hypothetical protein
MPDRTLMISKALCFCFFLSSTQGMVVSAETGPSESQIDGLVSKHCGTCHRAGGSGPFMLQDAQDLLKRKQFIKTVIESDLMPPWPLTSSLPVHGDRRLSDSDKKLLLEWLASGTSDENKTPLEPNTKNQTRKSSSAETFVQLAMRKSWIIPAEGGKRWFKGERDKRTFLIPASNQTDLRVREIMYTTTAPLAVAAVALSSDDTGQARRYIDWDTDSGTYMAGDVGFVAAGSLAVLGPAGGKLALPVGYHLSIPRNSDLVSEVHFRPQGREWTLEDSIRLKTVPDDVASIALVPVNLMLRKVVLLQGESLDDTREMIMEQDVTLVAVTPRAGRRCTRLSLVLESPDGASRTTILESDDWNPHYRSTLVLKTPVSVPAGSKLIGSWHYDNSESNPRNPVSPPEEVSLGARCGIANFLLLCAPNTQQEEATLRAFSRSVVRKAQR